MVVAHTEREEIELDAHRTLKDVRLETEVAACYVVGISALHVAVVDIDAKSPPLVEVVPVQAAESQIDLTQHTLVVQVADIVHTAHREAYLALAEPYLATRRHCREKQHKQDEIF